MQGEFEEVTLLLNWKEDIFAFTLVPNGSERSHRVLEKIIRLWAWLTTADNEVYIYIYIVYIC